MNSNVYSYSCSYIYIGGVVFRCILICILIVVARYVDIVVAIVITICMGKDIVECICSYKYS